MTGDRLFDIVDHDVFDVFATDLVRVEKLGPCCRLTFAVRQKSEGDSIEYHTVSRMIVPCDMLVTIGVQLVQRPDLTREAKATEPGHDLH